jgi:hypothetical protein
MTQIMYAHVNKIIIIIIIKTNKRNKNKSVTFNQNPDSPCLPWVAYLGVVLKG